MGDRADRLNRRRQDLSQSDDSSSDGEDDAVKTDNTDNTEKTDNGDGTETSAESGSAGSLSLTDSRKEQMMHLPEDQHKRLHHLYTRMKADYEYEFGEDFELNRQYFPLILQYGLDQFEQRDAEDVRQDFVEFGDDSQ